MLISPTTRSPGSAAASRTSAVVASGATPLFLRDERELARQPQRVERVDEHRLAGDLARAARREPANEVVAQPIGREGGRLLQEFVGVVLADVAQASGERRLDGGDRLALGNADKRDFGRITACLTRCCRDRLAHAGEPRGHQIHNEATRAGL